VTFLNVQPLQKSGDTNI